MDTIQFRIEYDNEEEEREPIDISTLNRVTPSEPVQCGICLDDINEECIQLFCNHKFHINCLQPWLTRNHTTCPTCRADIVSDTNTENTRPYTRMRYTTLPTRTHFPIESILSTLNIIKIEFIFENGNPENRSIYTKWLRTTPIFELLEFLEKFKHITPGFYIKINESVFKKDESFTSINRPIDNFTNRLIQTIQVFT